MHNTTQEPSLLLPCYSQSSLHRAREDDAGCQSECFDKRTGSGKSHAGARVTDTQRHSLHCYTDHLCCYWFMVYLAERAFISRSPRVALPRNSQIALTYTCSFPNFLSPHQQSHIRFPSL